MDNLVINEKRTSVHGTGSDVIDANATGLKLFADTAVIAGLALSKFSSSIKRQSKYRVKCSTGALLPA